MTVRREMSGTETFVYTQTWSIDNRLIGVTKALTSGLVLAQTSYFFDGDGTRVRKEDPDGTTLYVGVVEHIIGAPGTAMAEYYDDVSGPTLAGYVTKRSEPVVAGLQRSYTTTPSLPTMGDAPLRLRSGQAWAIRWQLWLTVPVTDTCTFAVQADDGFSFSGIGPVPANTTIRALTTHTSAQWQYVMRVGREAEGLRLSRHVLRAGEACRDARRGREREHPKGGPAWCLGRETRIGAHL